MAKRYYWLKLQHDFFSSKRIKKLRKIAGGDTYTIIYLKMQLKAITNDGCLTYSGIEPTFAEELALDIDENPDDVNVTINFLLQYGLMETTDNTNFSLPYAIQNTGLGDTSTERVRKFRERQKTPLLHETQCNVSCNADCNVEIEKEKEKEIDSEIEGEKKKRTKKFVAPTLEEVKAYASSRNSHVDPVKFWEYYDTGEWKDGKGQPVRNWKQKFLTWEKTDSPSRPSRVAETASHAQTNPSAISDLDKLLERMKCENS